MGCRVLKKNDKKITFAFKGASHKGIDLVGPGSTLDYITAHSDGEVVAVVSHIDYNTSKSGKRTYGNYVKIKHDNGMYTLPAPLIIKYLPLSKSIITFSPAKSVTSSFFSILIFLSNMLILPPVILFIINYTSPSFLSLIQICLSQYGRTDSLCVIIIQVGLGVIAANP